MKINVDKLRVLRGDIDRALESVAKKHGLVSIKCGKCKYDPNAGNFTMSLEGVAAGGTDKDVAAYERLRSLVPKFPPLKTSFSFRDRTYTITGASPNLRRIHANRDDGKAFTFHPDDVLRLVTEGTRTATGGNRHGDARS